MKLTTKLTVTAMLCCTLLSPVASVAEEMGANEKKNAVIGGIFGAVMGGAIAGDKNQALGAVLGAIAGSKLGAHEGRKMDNQPKIKSNEKAYVPESQRNAKPQEPAKHYQTNLPSFDNPYLAEAGEKALNTGRDQVYFNPDNSSRGTVEVSALFDHGNYGTKCRHFKVTNTGPSGTLTNSGTACKIVSEEGWHPIN